MSRNLLKDGDFEADWGDENSHHCLVFPEGADPYEKEVGNIFTPPGWITWFHHEEGVWSQPEVRDSWKHHDARRVHGGEKGMLLFTFHRKHDAGFLQQVQVTPGTRLRLTVWAHAWSNHKDPNQPEKFPHPSDSGWSEGAGYDPGFKLEGETSDDDWRNFTFSLGIDPTGGTNPFADTVVWGRGAHIYNQYAQPPAVEATAQADTVTVFLRSKTLWPFKHSDAYWDDAELVIVDGGEEEEEKEEVKPEKPEVRLSQRPASPKIGEAVTIEARSFTALTNVGLLVRQPSGAELTRGAVKTGRDGNWHTWTYTTSPLGEVGKHEIVLSAAGDVKVSGAFESIRPAKPQRGLPRDQYERTYVLLPSDANAAWARAVVDATWNEQRYTIGSSADDAGIGNLDKRRVIAVNPGTWPSDLRAFFKEHYAGVEYIPIEAANPQELRKKLRKL